MKTLNQIFNDPLVTDVCINGYDCIYLDRGTGLESYPESLFHSEQELQKWVVKLLSDRGRSWDAKNPFVDIAIPPYRIHVVFPPLCHSIHVSIRRVANSQSKRSWGNSLLLQRLLTAVDDKESILISGPTGSGKTTLMIDLLNTIPDQRIITLEDVAELPPLSKNLVQMVSRPPNPEGFGAVSLRQLLRQALRMRPDRIVMGECRGPEVLDLLQALNTGHRGTLGTVHANSPRDAIKRIELLCQMASNIPLSAIRELVAQGIRWIVQVQRTKNGQRKIDSLIRIEGMEGHTILTRPMLQVSNELSGSHV